MIWVLLLLPQILAASLEPATKKSQAATRLSRATLYDIPTDLVKFIAEYDPFVQLLLSRTCPYFNQVCREFWPRSTELADRFGLRELMFVPYHRDLEIFDEIHYKGKGVFPTEYAASCAKSYADSPVAPHLSLFLQNRILESVSDIKSLTKLPALSEYAVMTDVLVLRGRIGDAFHILKTNYFNHATGHIIQPLIKHLLACEEDLLTFYCHLKEQFWKQVLETELSDEDFLKLTWNLKWIKGLSSTGRSKKTVLTLRLVYPLNFFTKFLQNEPSDWIFKPRVADKFRLLVKSMKKSHCNAKVVTEALLNFKAAAGLAGLTDVDLKNLPEDLQLKISVLLHHERYEEMIHLASGIFGTIDKVVAHDGFHAYLMANRNQERVRKVLLDSHQLLRGKTDAFAGLYGYTSFEALCASHNYDIFDDAANVLAQAGSVDDFRAFFGNMEIWHFKLLFAYFLDHFTGTDAAFMELLNLLVDHYVQFKADLNRVCRFLPDKRFMTLFTAPEVAMRLFDDSLDISVIVAKSSVKKAIRESFDTLAQHPTLFHKLINNCGYIDVFTITDAELIMQLIPEGAILKGSTFKDNVVLHAHIRNNYPIYRAWAEKNSLALDSAFPEDNRTLRELFDDPKFSDQMSASMKANNENFKIASEMLLPAFTPRRLKLLRISLLMATSGAKEIEFEPKNDMEVEIEGEETKNA